MVRASGVPERARVLSLRDGRRLGWSEWGPEDGEPVLYLHGGPGSSHACPDVSVTHELRVRLIAVDRPGYGASEPDPGRRLLDDAGDLGELLDALAIESAPVVGWSMGSDFALGAGHRLGRRAARLALIAGDAPVDELPAGVRPAESLERTAQVRRDPVGERAAMLDRTRWLGENPVAMLEAAWQEPPTEDPDDQLRQQPDVRAMLVEMFRHAGVQGSVGWVDDSIAVQQPWGFRVAEVDRPATVWFGEADRLSSRAESEVLAAQLPTVQLRLVPGEGHLLPIRHWREILLGVLG